MPNAPYRLHPVTDPTKLLSVIRDSLRFIVANSIDGLSGDLNARDALTLIHADAAHTLAVIKASKDNT